MSRGSYLPLIPHAADRRGGTKTYIEWGWTVGLLQALIFQNLPRERPVRALDVGCGVGRLAIAYSPYLVLGDSYTGFDVNREDVDFCRRHYTAPQLSFLHFEAHNRVYAAGQGDGQVRWPVADGSFNVLTALSIWTHLDEADAGFYLGEVARALAPGGRAIISFFILDEIYDRTLAGRGERVSRFYPQLETKWIFDKPLDGSTEWFYPSWAVLPEEATAIRKPAFDRIIAQAGLKLEQFYPGSWKEQPGLFFQDIAIFAKT